MIREYQHKGQTCYRGMAICPICKEEYEIDTTDKELTVNPLPCFMCKVTGKNVIKNMTTAHLAYKCHEFLTELQVRINGLKIEVIKNKTEAICFKKKYEAFHVFEFVFGLIVGVAVGFLIAGKLLLK